MIEQGTSQNHALTEAITNNFAPVPHKKLTTVFRQRYAKGKRKRLVTSMDQAQAYFHRK